MFIEAIPIQTKTPRRREAPRRRVYQAKGVQQHQLELYHYEVHKRRKRHPDEYPCAICRGDHQAKDCLGLEEFMQALQEIKGCNCRVCQRAEDTLRSQQEQATIAVQEYEPLPVTEEMMLRNRIFKEVIENGQTVPNVLPSFAPKLIKKVRFDDQVIKIPGPSYEHTIQNEDNLDNVIRALMHELGDQEVPTYNPEVKEAPEMEIEHDKSKDLREEKEYNIDKRNMSNTAPSDVPNDPVPDDPEEFRHETEADIDELLDAYCEQEFKPEIPEHDTDSKTMEEVNLILSDPAVKEGSECEHELRAKCSIL
jgi:hypothetical protein